MSAPDKYWRRAYGDVVEGWDPDAKCFGWRARIRTGRTTRRVLYIGPVLETEAEALSDLDNHPRRDDVTTNETRGASWVTPR